MKIQMNDIYYKVGYSLAMRNFDLQNVETKKELLEEELRNYAIFKLKELGNNNYISEKVNVIDLVNLLGENIPQEEQFNTLIHLTHCILNIAGEMQGRSITWWGENEEEYKNQPLAVFNDEGFWDSLHTYNDYSYIKTFEFVHDIFINRFMKKEKIIKKCLDN